MCYDTFTTEEFIKMVEFGVFTDDDGYGNPIKKDGSIDSSVVILPSKTVPDNVTKIAWYNQ